MNALCKLIIPKKKDQSMKIEVKIWQLSLEDCLVLVLLFHLELGYYMQVVEGKMVKRIASNILNTVF